MKKRIALGFVMLTAGVFRAMAGEPTLDWTALHAEAPLALTEERPNASSVLRTGGTRFISSWNRISAGPYILGIRPIDMVDVPFEVSNRVEVFNVVDGGKQWEAFLDDAPTQVFIQGDAVYASTRKSVWALDLARGTARWRFDIASGAWVDHPEPASVEKLYDTTAAIKRMTSSGGQADPGMAMPDIAPSPDGSKIALLSWPGSITVLDAAARRSSTFDVPPADRAGANQTWSTVHWFDGGPIVCFGQQFIAYDSGFKERFRFKDTSGPLMTLVVLEEEKRILANVARQFYLLGRNGEVIAKTGYDDRMFFVGRIGGDYLFIHQAGHLRR